MTRTKSKPKSEYSIQTVSNALRMLEAFNVDDELGVSELSRRLELHKNNVFRLLATLEDAGYINQCPETELYRLGARCLELGHAFARSNTLMKRARPMLERLVAQVSETAHLGLLRDREVVHLDAVQPDKLLLSATRVGRRLPTHCTALGKVLLAFQLDAAAQRGSILESEMRTDATILDPEKLVEHLRSVALQGYAVDSEEFEVGLRCVAAPVFGPGRTLLGALSISAPSVRLTEDALHGDVMRAVVAAADRLSEDLGCDG